eukprot:scaffold10273_cov122-Isochrysis_galbana.AAC.2
MGGRGARSRRVSYFSFGGNAPKLFLQITLATGPEVQIPHPHRENIDFRHPVLQKPDVDGLRLLFAFFFPS